MRPAKKKKAAKQLCLGKYAFTYKIPPTPLGELSILYYSTWKTQNTAS